MDEDLGEQSSSEAGEETDAESMSGVSEGENTRSSNSHEDDYEENVKHSQTESLDNSEIIKDRTNELKSTDNESKDEQKLKQKQRSSNEVLQNIEQESIQSPDSSSDEEAGEITDPVGKSEANVLSSANNKARIDYEKCSFSEKVSKKNRDQISEGHGMSSARHKKFPERYLHLHVAGEFDTSINKPQQQKCDNILKNIRDDSENAFAVKGGESDVGKTSDCADSDDTDNLVERSEKDTGLNMHPVHNTEKDPPHSENTNDLSGTSDGEIDSSDDQTSSAIQQQIRNKNEKQLRDCNLNSQNLDYSDSALPKALSQVKITRTKQEHCDLQPNSKMDEAEEISDEGLVSDTDSDEGLLSESSDEEKKSGLKRTDSIEDDTEQLDYEDGEEGEIQESKPRYRKPRRRTKEREEVEVVRN